MMMKLRHASAVNIDIRISLRFAIIGCICSEGSDCKACISEDEMKDEKNRVGAMANKSDMPPVAPKLIYNAFLFAKTLFGFSIISFSASIAKSGMVNSATTKMDDTVRNLLYIGT